MHFITKQDGGYIFAAGELLILQYCGAICLACRCVVDESHRYRGSGVICMPCTTGKWSILSLREYTSIVYHDLGLKYNSREYDILNNYRYRHIRSGNSGKIGSRNVERVLHTILNELW